MIMYDFNKPNQPHAVLIYVHFHVFVYWADSRPCFKIPIHVFVLMGTMYPM